MLMFDTLFIVYEDYDLFAMQEKIDTKFRPFSTTNTNYYYQN